MKIFIKGEHKAPRARMLVGNTAFKQKVEKDRTKYNRKAKHKGDF